MATISVSLPADGSSADVQDYNTPITTITNAINGNLDSNNISSLNGSKLVAASVPASALDANTTAGWVAGLAAPNTITALGNRSYSMVFNSVNYSTTLSAGMRGRTTRTVAAPTQCTSLNGTTQYYSKSSPAGMSFTDDFVAGAWVKLAAYNSGAAQTIISRFNGTSGWSLTVEATGQIQLAGFNASASNYSLVKSYQSIPVGKWVYVTAQLDMSAFTATTTTSYVMIDGIDVPASVARAGTNPTALVQAGSLEVGSGSATGFFNGKIAQAFVSSAKITQANVLTLISQGLTTANTATYSIASAYSFDNSITDLNTTSANNLTANGSAVATNADSPFGGQADGTISSTLDYAIVQKVAFSTNTTVTVQVPEGCTIPTSGGVSAVVYSSSAEPYGFPGGEDRWSIDVINKTLAQQSTAVADTWYQLGQLQSNVPIGKWRLTYWVGIQMNGTAGSADLNSTLATTTAAETDTLMSGSISGNSAIIGGNFVRTTCVLLASATTYYLNSRGHTVLASNTLYNRGDVTPTLVRATNAYL